MHKKYSQILPLIISLAYIDQCAALSLSLHDVADRTSNEAGEYEVTETVHVVIMGVAGCGKTTVAGILHDRWGWDSAEADEFHPQANVEKMHSGIPLSDEDRWPWLHSIRAWMSEKENDGKSTIVTCSALKKSYRDVLRKGSARVIFMHLDGERTLLATRLGARTGHFMPASLLDSQYATLEPLEPTELGARIDIGATPTQIANTIEHSVHEILHAKKTKPHTQTRGNEEAGRQVPQGIVGVYGLGVMGSALARNLARHFPTVVTNIDPSYTTRFIADHAHEGTIIGAATMGEFIASLKRPRTILLMVTAGDPVDSVLHELSAHLESGDIVVDMGNSHFLDTRRRELAMRQLGIHFLGCGTSGGQEGALKGPALMIGGNRRAYEHIQPIFETIAARAKDGKSCAVYLGPDGAGHLTKTLHNGIEYAEMQVIAEVTSLLHSCCGLDNPETAKVLEEWNRGELSSYLLQISADILRPEDDFIDQICDRASHKGTGAWSTMIGVELGVNTSMLASALFARLESQSSLRDAWPHSHTGDNTHDQRKKAHSELTPDDLRRAMWLAKLVAYTQGFEVIEAASAHYKWDIALAPLCQGWKAGCIIRCAMLDDFADILTDGSPQDILLKNAGRVEDYLPSLRKAVSIAALNHIPLADLPAALSVIESLRSRRLPSALIQAQRDYFGAHGVELLGKNGLFHGPWHDKDSAV